MNFFSWIRDGVRRAILLGVSDAVGDIGVPDDNDDISQRLLQAIKTTQPALGEQKSFDRGPRKKLGRSLEQIQAAAKAS